MKCRERIAIVGGGVAGITAAHILSRKHEVTLFEASEALGGHANAVRVENGRDAAFDLDTAFLIFNDGSYPLFLRLLGQLGLSEAVVDADMSMSFHNQPLDLQYAVNCGWRGLFADRSNLVSPRFWRLLAEIRRFRNGFTREAFIGKTLGELVRSSASQHLLAENFLFPLGASVWSLPASALASFPAETFYEFFSHHRALKRETGKGWRTMRGSSRRYIDAFEQRFRGRIVKGRRIQRILRGDTGITVVGHEGDREAFDRLILATHADQALRLLDQPTEEERKALGIWEYRDNPTVLHTDRSLMPSEPRAWASWNIGFDRDAKTGEARHTVTYDLNRIQAPPTSTRYFVSWGDRRPSADSILRRFSYRHPVFSRRSIAAQPELRALNGKQAAYFCGSYCGNGFHEAAIASAVEVTRHFGMEL